LIPEEALVRAKKYSHIKYAMAIFDTVYLLVLILLFEALGLAKDLSQLVSSGINLTLLVFPVYLLAIFGFYYLLNLPFNIYRSFILEHKFNLTKQKFADWLSDQLKGFILTYILSLILFGTFYFILKTSPLYWWLITALVWLFFSVVIARILPVVIVPLFFKYKPLADSVLKERIVGLAKKMQVQILDVFEIDFSKKTLKANAAFVGWGKTRRVILADTLKDKYSHDEIEVILAHEFAHYKLKHLIKLILINALSTIFMFFLIFKTSSFVLHKFNLSTLEDLAAFPIIILYMTLLGIIIQPLENFLSRSFEKDADRHALEITGSREAFVSMMNKLSDQNLSDRKPHPIIKFFFFDHPPTDERIEMAKSHLS